MKTFAPTGSRNLQIDCEMALCSRKISLTCFEGLVKRIFKDVKGIDYNDMVERMTWEDAMWHYGNDKPDIRFGMHICNLKKPGSVYVNKEDKAALINGADFKVFDDAETVLCIAVPGCSEYTESKPMK